MQNIPFSAPMFALRGIYTGRVVSLHDGDTFTCVIPFLTNNYYKFSIRLNGIDTAEMTSKDPDLRSRAFMARDRLFELLTGQKIDTISWRKSDFDKYFEKNYTTVMMNCTELDKYGRVLADVSNFSDILVKEKLAYRYDGGTKLSEEDIKRTFGL
jgi:endonuclease YncB( thermonuclease family)